ncbi:hypothetical protein FRC07_011161 [Ceratobasidium sp. 392]|nr:hypothetical protein FRC07_011161 [Ceratobasidium sp. 392]
MAPSVLRSKSAPTTKPLSAHFLPKNVSFSTLDAPTRPTADLQLSERVEAFNLSGGFFPSQADEYDWVSANDDTMESLSKTRRTLSSGLHTPAASESPISSFSSLPATPGVGILHRPLPDELDHMATEAIKSEDKMGVLKITARGLSTLILSSGGDGSRPDLSPDAEPLSDDALYSSIRARRQEATTPADEQPKFGELFLNPDSASVSRPRGWSAQDAVWLLHLYILFRAKRPSKRDPSMKLDATDLRYITNDEFRVLTSVEMGSKNHEVVPSSLVAQISGLRNGGVNKLLGQLAKRNLIARVQNTKYDGYRLTYGGYDYLALRAFTKRDTVHSVGNQIGVGKESGGPVYYLSVQGRSSPDCLLDIYVVADSEGNQMVLKIHRLGRVSFRAIKEKRDYMGKRKSASWMYMSRLAAKKEWEFMKVLHEHGFPVPKPIDQARHCILMELIDAFPLRQISSHPSPGSLYSTLMDVIVRFAKAGLIHGDFNEFNILIRRETGVPVVIDFPQMVSTRHANAEWYFNRDVECIRKFFRRRFNYESAVYPRFSKVIAPSGGDDGEGFRLDVVVAASGFGGKEMKILDEYIASKLEEEGGSGSEVSSTEAEEEDGEEDSGDKSPEFRQVRPAAQDDATRQERRNLLDQPLSENEGEDTHTPSPVSAPLMSSMRIQEDIGNNSGIGNNNGSIEDDRELCDDGVQEDRGVSDNEGGEGDQQPNSVVRDLVASTLEKEQRRNAKYHSKRGTTKVGRAKGHKGKMNVRLKADSSGVWD